MSVSETAFYIITEADCAGEGLENTKSAKEETQKT
jgi:hypothetical protein